MWRCGYCRKRFNDRDEGINHARAEHSRDYATCEYVPSPEPTGHGWLPRLTSLPRRRRKRAA